MRFRCAVHLKGGWKDKDKKADCLAQGFLSQDIEQYSSLPFNLNMEARDVAEKMGRILNGTHTSALPPAYRSNSVCGAHENTLNLGTDVLR